MAGTKEDSELSLSLLDVVIALVFLVAMLGSLVALAILFAG